MSGLFAGARGGSWFTVLAMAFAVVAGVLVFAVLQSDREEQPVIDTISVVVATQDIEPRTRITASMVRTQDLPAEMAVERGFQDVDAVVGLIARYPVASNEQLTALKVGANVKDSNEDGGDGLSFVIPQGKRAIGISVTEQSAVGGLIIAGDRVDVIAVFDKEVTGTERSFTLLQDVEVLAVAQVAQEAVPPSLTVDDSNDADRTTASSASLGVRPTETEPQPDARTVTLAVSPEQAQELALVDQNAELWLSLRPFEEDETPSVRPTRLDVLVDVLALGVAAR